MVKTNMRTAISLGLIFLLGTLAGCSREPEPTYQARENLDQTSEANRALIEKTLREHFGTASNPLLRVPETLEGEKLVEVIPAKQLQEGMRIYNRRCASCHGITGDGAGQVAEYLMPVPRDYRRGKFKFTSTQNQAKPRRSDLVHTIRRGAKGTSMPSFAWLPDDEVSRLVDYVIMLSQRGELEYLLTTIAQQLEDEELEAELIPEFAVQINDGWKQAEEQVVYPVTPMPLKTEETILAGRKAFLSQGCSKCHGTDGKGQTEWLSKEFIAKQESLPESKREKINRDIWGNVAPAADLTAGMLHGGRRPIDIYRRIYSGITGTPMPSFKNAFQDKPETIWHLVHFVEAVTQGRKFPEPTPEELQPASQTAATVDADGSFSHR